MPTRRQMTQNGKSRVSYVFLVRSLSKSGLSGLKSKIFNEVVSERGSCS